MDISAAKIYKSNDLFELIEAPAVNKINSKDSSRASNSVSNNLTGHNKILSRNEKDFFIQMFPEHSNQIEKHILFNNNGRLSNPDINKGLIVDGRV